MPQFATTSATELAKAQLMESINNPIEGRCAAVHYSTPFDEFGNVVYLIRAWFSG